MNAQAILEKIKQYPVPVVCGIVIVIALILLFIRGPKAEELDGTLSDYERNWKQIQANASRSRGLESHVKKLENLKSEVDSRLMSTETVAINYEFFYALEKQTGVRITSMDQREALEGNALPGQIAGMENYIAIPYNLIIEGRFSQILEFLKELNRGRYIIRLDTFNFSATQSEDASGEIVSRFELFILGRKNE